MKQVLSLITILCIVIIILSGCSLKTKTVHCDNCGKAVTINEESPMNDDEWLIYCSDCEKKLGLDKIVPLE